MAAYVKEEQGESLAWLNDSVFYTTSDSKDDTPIYKYVRWNASTQEPDVEPLPIDSAAKAINEVVLSNGYYAFINEGENIIRGWYMQGDPVPEVESYILSERAAWSQEGNSVTITALNGSTATYTTDFQPVTPVAFTDTLIVFNGSESSWVKSAYGWDATKKWRFSKTDEDYSREIAGKTHVELFLPACDTVVLTSMASKEREVKFYINGDSFGSKTKLLVAGNTLVVEQQQPFMLSIVSAQSSGDGGIASIRLARKKTVTATESIRHSEVRMQKLLRNGTLYILRGEQLYTLTGLKADL